MPGAERPCVKAYHWHIQICLIFDNEPVLELEGDERILNGFWGKKTESRSLKDQSKQTFINKNRLMIDWLRFLPTWLIRYFFLLLSCLIFQRLTGTCWTGVARKRSSIRNRWQVYRHPPTAVSMIRCLWWTSGSTLFRRKNSSRRWLGAALLCARKAADSAPPPRPELSCNARTQCLLWSPRRKTYRLLLTTPTAIIAVA